MRLGRWDYGLPNVAALVEQRNLQWVLHESAARSWSDRCNQTVATYVIMLFRFAIDLIDYRRLVT